MTGYDLVAIVNLLEDRITKKIMDLHYIRKNMNLLRTANFE